jgi:hypothetical protein
MRRTAALAATLLTAVVLASPAQAAGTGDVELIPLDSSGAATSFTVDDDQDEIRFELVNLSREPRTATVYAASADESGSGAVTVGSRGSAPWLELDDLVVELGPGETRTFSAPLDEGALPEEREQLGAVVLEAVQGSVTVRVATLVTVEPRSALPVPLWLVGVALAVLLAAVGLLLVAWRRRRREDEDRQQPATV